MWQGLSDTVMEAYDLTVPTTFGELLDQIARLQEETDFFDTGYLLVDMPLDQENLVHEVLKRFFLEQQAPGRQGGLPQSGAAGAAGAHSHGAACERVHGL